MPKEILRNTTEQKKNLLISGKVHFQIGCETTQIYYEHLNSRYGFPMAYSRITCTVKNDMMPENWNLEPHD